MTSYNKSELGETPILTKRETSNEFEIKPIV